MHGVMGIHGKLMQLESLVTTLRVGFAQERGLSHGDPRKTIVTSLESILLTLRVLHMNGNGQ